MQKCHGRHAAHDLELIDSKIFSSQEWVVGTTQKKMKTNLVMSKLNSALELLLSQAQLVDSHQQRIQCGGYCLKVIFLLGSFDNSSRRHYVVVNEN